MKFGKLVDPVDNYCHELSSVKSLVGKFVDLYRPDSPPKWLVGPFEEGGIFAKILCITNLPGIGVVSS